MLALDLNLPPSSSRAQLEKVVMARRVGQFLAASKSDGERHVVENVARSLAADLSQEVRQTLAFELRRANQLPFDIADRIARDVEEVSSPFLAGTEAFTPDELALLVHTLDEHARVAVARRSTVDGIVAVAIAESGGERSVTFLIRNPGADMVPDACYGVVKRFGGNRAMMEYLAARADFPIEIAHRLIDRISSGLRAELIARHGLDPELGEVLSGAAKASSLLRWIKTASRGRLIDYVRAMEERGALTERLLFDMTWRGGIRLFESVMAHRTGIDVDKVEAIVRANADEPYLGKLLRKAGYDVERSRRLAAAVAEGMKKL